jgi:hypothetical protein
MIARHPFPIRDLRHRSCSVTIRYQAWLARNETFLA